MPEKLRRDALRDAAVRSVVETLERRALMSVDVTFTPFASGVPGAPIPFIWNTPVQGRDVVDSAPTQPSLLRRSIPVDPNDTFLDLAGQCAHGNVLAAGEPLQQRWRSTRHAGNETKLSEIRPAARRNGATQDEYFQIDLDNINISSYRVTSASNLGPIEEFTITFDRPVDTTAPQLLTRVFEFDTAQEVRLGFSENVGPSLNTSDFTLTNLTTNQVVPAAQLAISYDFATNTATLTAPGAPGGVLADGNYRLQFLSAGIRDGNNNQLAAAPNFEFFVFAGDATRDRNVNIMDFSLLATNFNQPGTFVDGDFNYTGQVDIADFSILASKFNTSLPAPRAAPSSPFSSTLPGARSVAAQRAPSPFSTRVFDEVAATSELVL